MPLTVTALLIIIALAFNFLNGFHDSGNIVATIISSRALPPTVALTITAVAEFVAPFIFGVAVATTIGQDIVTPGIITIKAVLAALLSAILWNLVTWFLGIPSSSSHALVGGIVGAVGIERGLEAIQISGLGKVVVALFASPMVGLVAGYFNWFFKRFQIVTGVALACSHGANDAQKTIGIITLGLVATGFLTKFQILTWVVALSAGAIALGIAFGGWRLIRTLGGKFYKIRPVHGFSSQITSAAVIFGATWLGGPVSTTQVVSSAILGVGSAERLNKVRWGVAGYIAVAWLLTVPLTALFAAGLYWLVVAVMREIWRI
jgi:PiT family inorganic phosphate transporter